MSTTENGLLKMSQLAEASGVSSGTIKHYLREGLLPEPVRLLGVPVKLSRTPGAPQGPGPALGENTGEVLGALGYSDEDVAALTDEGAVAGPPAGAQGSFLA